MYLEAIISGLLTYITISNNQSEKFFATNDTKESLFLQRIPSGIEK